MVLESLGLTWLWTSSSLNPAFNISVEKNKSKKNVRHGTDNIAVNGSATGDTEKSRADNVYYPGLVNVSGTYCFMNATLQALASLSYLQPYLSAVHAKAEALDVPTPVIDALEDLFRRLNSPRSSYHSIHPVELIQALSEQTEGRTNTLFHSREHQDAQELFQLLSECLKNETIAVDKEGWRDRGLGAMSQMSAVTREIGKNVFDGLTANRRSCIACGYTEAVMHFALDNWQLAVPRLATSCRLEDCLEDYTRLEILKDCICRKCSLVETHRRLQNELRVLEDATRSELKPSSSKRKRLKDVRKMEARVKAALQNGRIEDDLKGVRVEKIVSPASTKQAMIARPPQVLALHINRSVHYGQYATKNNVNVIFPEVLDLTPYTTSGSLSTVPTSAISTPPPVFPRSTTPTPTTFAHTRTLYRMSAVVCHYGQHSFGHYVCYRRKPKPPNYHPSKRWAPPKLVDPLGPDDDAAAEDKGPRYAWEGEDPPTPGEGWLRLSDKSVSECGMESVLQEGSGAFMLYYERVVPERTGVYGMRSGSARGSEETLKPKVKMVDINLNGSAATLLSEVGRGVMNEKRHELEPESNGLALGLPSSMPQASTLGARVVRNVATRKRSSSAGPSDRCRKSLPSESSVSGVVKRALGMSGEANGHAIHFSVGMELQAVVDMTASAPTILSSSPSSLLSSHQQSPTAVEPSPPTGPWQSPPSTPSLVGLRAER